jgi:hypothetical protein
MHALGGHLDRCGVYRIYLLKRLPNVREYARLENLAWNRSKVMLHLSEEEVFSSCAEGSLAKYIRSNKNAAVCRRKESERFHRSVLRVKSAKRAKRAEKHGWFSTGGIRGKGDNQH